VESGNGSCVAGALRQTLDGARSCLLLPRRAVDAGVQNRRF